MKKKTISKWQRAWNGTKNDFQQSTKLLKENIKAFVGTELFAAISLGISLLIIIILLNIGVKSNCFAAGFPIAFVSGNPDKGWDDWYTNVTEKHGLSKKPAFIGMSRGGFNEYVWATAHPDCVSCIYADNPAVSRDSLLKVPGLASNNVPLLHICGSLDPFMLDNSFAIESLYQTAGGRISMTIKEGYGHHPHTLRSQYHRGLHGRQPEPARLPAPLVCGFRCQRHLLLRKPERLSRLCCRRRHLHYLPRSNLLRLLPQV